LNKQQSILEAYKEYLLIIKALAKNSVDAYLSDVEKFLSYVDGDISKIDTYLILEYLTKYSNPRTRNRKATSINLFLLFCHDEFNIKNISKVQMAKLPKTLPHYLTFDEIKAGLKQISTDNIYGLRDYAMILFLYATGLRVSELIEVKKSDIEGNWVKVRYAKGSKQRLVPIAQEAIDSLNIYLTQRTIKSDYLWINYKGNKLSRVSVFKITKKIF
jgi:integrase/recombinase XerD